ncbi:MAG: hypothetical protein ABI425_03090 [Patescibacteria group bacterium]
MSNLLASIDLGTAIKINDTQSVGEQYKDLGSLINLIVPNIFLLAGVIFLFLMIAGGLSIISSESTKSVEEGQKKITSALIGFVVMFSAYWIIQVVELLTGLKIL